MPCECLINILWLESLLRLIHNSATHFNQCLAGNIIPLHPSAQKALPSPTSRGRLFQPPRFLVLNTTCSTWLVAWQPTSLIMCADSRLEGGSSEYWRPRRQTARWIRRVNWHPRGPLSLLCDRERRVTEDNRFAVHSSVLCFLSYKSDLQPESCWS